jgi:peptidoglycan LD-endopeptidase CwlK
MLFGVAAYFLFACAVLAFVFLPPARAWAQLRARRWLANGRAVTRSTAAAGQQGLARTAGAVGGAGAHARGWLAERAGRIGLALAVLLLPPLLALVLRGQQELGSFDHTVSHVVNEQVASLLKGEQLSPPAPLPPELFMTPEVERARPLIRYASREWELLDDEFRKRLLVMFKLMQDKHGYEMVLLEGYRSPERQAQLAALGSQVTRAGAYRSYHQYGLAADVAFRRDGRVVIRETDPWVMRGYEHYGELAAAAGLVWGGAWSLRDFGHVELRRPGVMRTGSENRGAATAQEQ